MREAGAAVEIYGGQIGEAVRRRMKECKEHE